MHTIDPSRRGTYLLTCRVLATLSAASALFYLKWLVFDAKPDNVVLFGLLVGAEFFNIAQAAGFWYTIARQTWTEPEPLDSSMTRETVDVFVTVCGEPEDIVEKTIAGAVAIRHPRKRVWVLDDGKSPQVEVLADRYKAGYLTRPDRRGAKAGNLNDAMARTEGDFILILDADHVPKPEFLEMTLGALEDASVSFVQTPQFYANRRTNRVAAGAHEQQGLFYGPILRGKDARNAVFSCGTNVIFRRSALVSIGGMPEDSITEDLRVSLILAKAGYRSVYVPIVLAHGMGPVDVRSFFTQQFRWARGGLEILFKTRPFFLGMKIGTMIQYSLGFMYWFTGWAYAAYLVLPIAFLGWGLRPVQVPNQYPVYFLPYIVMTLVTIAFASDFRLTFRGLWFTLASFPTFIRAFLSLLVGRAATFVVTSKGVSSRSLRPVLVQMLAITLLAASSVVGVAVGGVTPSVMNNVAFALGHILILQGFVRYARHPEGRDWLAEEEDAEMAAAEALLAEARANLESTAPVTEAGQR